MNMNKYKKLFTEIYCYTGAYFDMVGKAIRKKKGIRLMGYDLDYGDILVAEIYINSILNNKFKECWICKSKKDPIKINLCYECFKKAKGD